MAAGIRVAVVGYGVIGKRVADAVAAQPDMDLIGVCDLSTDHRIEVARRRGFRLFAPTSKDRDNMASVGLPMEGVLADLLDQTDVAIDCTPKHVAATNREAYQSAGVRSIFQGGESHDLTGHSFVAQANYASARGRSTTRVVSCNTTATVRVLGALAPLGIVRARGVLIRRATDPWESHMGGIMNTVVPELHIPSHQAVDAQTILADMDIVTMACKVSETLSHLHYWWLDLERSQHREDVVALLREAPRIALLDASSGLGALNAVLELTRDLGRPRGDLWEVGLWEDILHVAGSEAFFCHQVDNQSIVVPENIDAVRALMDVCDGPTSIARTDAALGIDGVMTADPEGRT